jgi:hypothetical protein
VRYSPCAAASRAPLTYRFHFGDDAADLTQSTGQVQHTYRFDATFFPTVTVTDATGASATTAACTLPVTTAKDSVNRYAGDDRYLTSSAVVLASGEGFADALAAGPAATGDVLSSQGKPAAIVLSDGSRITDAATRAFVEARVGSAPAPVLSHVLALGGQATCAVQSIDAKPGTPPCLLPPLPVGVGGFDTIGGGKAFQAVVGADRFQTAAGLAASGLTDHTERTPDGLGFQDDRGLFGLASGTSYADALTGGAAMAVEHAPIVLTARGYFPAATGAFINGITNRRPATDTFAAAVFGGPAAIAPALENALIADIKP